MKLDAGWASDVGLVRELNEDSYLIDADLKVFAVADGVGGHRGGEVASSTAIETLRASIATGATLIDAIRDANRAVHERSMRDPDLFGMGTTLTVAMPLSNTELVIGHVGDSRAYLLRKGQLTQISEDHSMVKQLVRDGQITEEQAVLHPRRNVITRAIGMESSVSVDLITVTVNPYDRLLLCSDGITDMLHDADLQLVLSAANTAQASAETLADRALANGGIDNLTAVVIDIVSEVGEVVTNHGDTVTFALQTIEEAAGSMGRPPGPIVRTNAEAPNEPTPPANYETPTSETKATNPRRFWGRFRWLFITLIPLALALGIGVGALKYFNNHQWYVGTQHGKIALLQGSPDAPLGWKPRAQQVSKLAITDIRDQAVQQAVKNNKHCKSNDEAAAKQCFQYVERLAQTTTTPVSTTTTTTSTTTTSTTTPVPTTASPTPIPSGSP